MKKIAFFVEGPTEADFVRRLLQEYTSRRCLVRVYAGEGGKKFRRTFKLVYSDNNNGQEYTIHIYISSTDNRVNSDVRDSLPTLYRAGFTAVVSLKDLRGDKSPGVSKTLADLPAMEMIDNTLFSHANPPVNPIIAVMEVETWFIAETNHYSNIDPGLTRALIESNVENLEANPYTDNLTLVTKPAEMLDNIYQLRGKHYRKDEVSRQCTVNALDYAILYMNVSARLMKLNDFFMKLDLIFS